jgi:hypothetical protein
MLTQMATPEASVVSSRMNALCQERAKRESGTTGKHSGGRADAAVYGNRVPQNVVQKCTTILGRIWWQPCY